MNSFVCDWSRRSVPAFRWDKKRGEEEEEEEGRKEERATHVQKREKKRKRKERKKGARSIEKKSREIGFVIRFHIATPINYNFLFNLCETRFIKLVPRSVNFYGERERDYEDLSSIDLPRISPLLSRIFPSSIQPLFYQNRHPRGKHAQTPFPPKYAQILFSRVPGHNVVT